MDGTSTGTLGRRLGSLSWVHRSLLLGALVLVVYVNWRAGGLRDRVIRETVLFIVIPLLLALANGQHIGWRIDRRAIRNTVLLSLFVLPIYLVGSTLPTIRAFYPMWQTTLALGDFLPHAVQLFVIALATETYFRGLLCVGVRDIGLKCVLISPIVYALLHASKPPIEFVLSGPTDVLFGTVDYYSDSILPSTVAHGLGLVFLDWLVLRPPVLPPDRVLSWLRWVPVPL